MGQVSGPEFLLERIQNLFINYYFMVNNALEICFSVSIKRVGQTGPSPTYKILALDSKIYEMESVKRQPFSKKISINKAVPFLKNIDTMKLFHISKMKTLQRWISNYGEWKKTWLRRLVSSCLNKTEISFSESRSCSTIWNEWKLS